MDREVKNVMDETKHPGSPADKQGDVDDLIFQSEAKQTSSQR